MIKPIVLYGNEILRKRSVDYKVGARLKSFIRDMRDTMENAAGAGLAAPQIGVNKRLFVIYLNKDFEKVFINPVIHEVTGDWMVMEEGCLSLPDIAGNVIRKNKIVMSYYDENWEFHDHEEFEGLEARVIQHEYDHLEGVLWIERANIKDTQKLLPELIKIKNREVHIKYPIV